MYKKFNFKHLTPNIQDKYRKLFYVIDGLSIPSNGMSYHFNDIEKAYVKIEIEKTSHKVYFSLFINKQTLFHFILIKPQFSFCSWTLLKDTDLNILRKEEEFDVVFNLFEKKIKFLNQKDEELFAILKEVSEETTGMFDKTKEK